MIFPDKKTVERIRNEYPPGTKIELIEMDDPYGRLKPGDRGVVRYVDDVGTIFPDWNRGGSLGLVYGQDRYKKVTD